MPTTQIAWNTGSGNITLTYTGQGDGTISVQSDENNGAARSQVITVQTLDGVVTRNLTVSQVACPFPVGDIRNFSYTGDYQEVELPAGQYKLQCWGAQGGSNATASSYGITAQAGGKGGYSEGIITLSQKTTVRVYVGGQGSASAGGFNGGGSTTGSSAYNSGNEQGVSRMGGGGGATDIRLSDGALLSRMIVAGGGGGGAACYKRVTNTQTVRTIESPQWWITECDNVTLNATFVGGMMFSTQNTLNAVAGHYVNVVRIPVTAASGSVKIHLTSSNSAGSTSILKTVEIQVPQLSSPRDFVLPETIYVGSGQGLFVESSVLKYKGSVGSVFYRISSPYNTIVQGGSNHIHGIGYGYIELDSAGGTISSVNGQWATSSNYYGALLDVSNNRGDTFVATKESYAYGMVINFLKSYPTSGQACSFATGYNKNGITTTGSTLSGTVPSDANYMFVYLYGNGLSYMPDNIVFTREVPTETRNSQNGYVGGGIDGGGYSNTYKGKQNAAGVGGTFGYGANQSAANYRYCSGAGGGGWYGGGGGQYSYSSMDYCKYSGGGSGFVNTSASAGNRPSGYTGLQLDSGSTTDGSSSFPAPGGGNETGHAGNGYARITRLT